jgi:hypothetical protein
MADDKDLLPLIPLLTPDESAELAKQMTTGTISLEANAARYSAMVRDLLVLNRAYHGQGGHPDQTGTPANLLASWREILIALGLKNNRADKGKVSRLNKTRAGPIIISGQGKQPLADKAKLIDWWNKLTIQYETGFNRARDAQPTAENRHDYGRDGEVAPDVSGAIKKRRRDRRP